MPPPAPGLRERKKAKTRRAISDMAIKMFVARGFDAVTVAEVAAAADVSVGTIFNYFDAKEDLFFDRDDEVLAAQVRFIRERGVGESIASAMRRAFHAAIESSRLLTAEGKGFARTIEASPALRARARFALEKTEAALAEVIAEETGAAKGDPRPRALAAMIVAIERMLMEDARAAVLRGDATATARRTLKRTCERAFELLEGGTATYGRRARDRTR